MKFCSYSKVANEPKQNSDEEKLVSHNILMSNNSTSNDFNLYDWLSDQPITWADVQEANQCLQEVNHFRNTPSKSQTSPFRHLQLLK